MADVYNMKGKKLFAKSLNCHLITVETLGEQPLSCYTSMAKCMLCEGHGFKEEKTFIFTKKVRCKSCNGAGILMKMLSPEQIPAHSFGTEPEPSNIA